jgi:hypothetical protein
MHVFEKLHAKAHTTVFNYLYIMNSFRKLFYRKTVQRGKLDTFNTHMLNCSLNWISIDTSVTSGGIKLVYWVQNPPFLRQPSANRTISLANHKLKKKLKKEKTTTKQTTKCMFQCQRIKSET